MPPSGTYAFRRVIDVRVYIQRYARMRVARQILEALHVDLPLQVSGLVMVLVPPGVSEHDLGRDLVHETLETLIIGTDVLKLMMEDPRFGTLTYMIGRYPHDVMVEGYKAQSKLYNMTAAMIAGMDMPGAQPAVEEIISCRPDARLCAIF